MKIVFMGSSEFAVPIFLKIINYNCRIISVYTKMHTRSKRGLQKNRNIIYNLAKRYLFNVLTPGKLRTLNNIKYFKLLNPDIVIVVSYGLLIPREFFKIPKYGFINTHPSNLPKWRGSAPVERAIIAGDKKIYLCIIKMTECLDVGRIIFKKKIIVDIEISAKELKNKCSKISGKMIINILKLLKKGFIQCTNQNGNEFIYAKKIKLKEGVLNFNLDALEVNNKIRALSSKCGAYIIFRDEVIKIIFAKIERTSMIFKPGVTIDNKLGIACKKNIIRPIILQRYGRKMMHLEDFLRGVNLQAGSIFGI